MEEAVATGAVAGNQKSLLVRDWGARALLGRARAVRLGAWGSARTWELRRFER